MGTNLMPRRKFVIGSSYRAAKNWIERWHLAAPGYSVLTEMNKLRGIDPETIEFILLDGHWISDIFKHDSEYYYYRYLLNRGAIENRVYG